MDFAIAKIADAIKSPRRALSTVMNNVVTMEAIVARILKNRLIGSISLFVVFGAGQGQTG